MGAVPEGAGRGTCVNCGAAARHMDAMDSQRGGAARRGLNGSSESSELNRLPKSAGRRPDSGSRRRLSGASLVLGPAPGSASRRKRRPVPWLGLGAASVASSGVERRGVAGNREAGFDHSLRKTQIYWALTKGHSGLTPFPFPDPFPNLL
jgi:hypothetical protein